MATKKKKRVVSSAIVNRRASFDYALGDELTTGIVLSGRETRAARDGRVQLKGAFVTIRNNELWLNNASFSLTLNTKGVSETTVDTTARKLLASRKQIDALAESKQTGMTVVPLRLLTKERYYAKSASEGTLEYQRIVDRPYIAKLMGSQTMINLSEVSHKGVTFSPGWIFATHFNLAAASDSMPASIDGVYPIRASAFIADFPEAKQAFRTMEPWVDEQSFNYVRVHVARAQDRVS